MPDHVIGIVGIAAILGLIALRFPVALALGGVALLGLFHLLGTTATLGLLGTVPYTFAARWELSAIPMFLLMGTIAYYSGMTTSLYRAARLWLGFLPGGLAVASNFACAGFAAASGSSLATTVAMGRISIPEMMDAGYDKGLATGVVASAGNLGSLIPPSVLMILYAVFAEQSAGTLFIAGILPGLLTAGIYAVMIIVRCRLKPALAPPVDHTASWEQKLSVLASIWPLPVLIVAVIGGIYGGVVTPTEAGAFGAALAFLIAVLQGRMSWSVLRQSAVEALESTATIFFVAVGAVLLTRFMAISGLPGFLVSLLGDWAVSPYLLIVGAAAVFLVLGMFLDPIGLMLLTLPIFLPLFEALELNPIWMGILVVKYVEIGLMTPPVGLNVYAVKSIVGEAVPLGPIFRGVGWFLGCEVVIVALLIVFPQIILFLPGLMR
jgi:C4-dicarboxylate transporter DctM subunit